MTPITSGTRIAGMIQMSGCFLRNDMAMDEC